MSEYMCDPDDVCVCGHKRYEHCCDDECLCIHNEGEFGGKCLVSNGRQLCKCLAFESPKEPGAEP